MFIKTAVYNKMLVIGTAYNGSQLKVPGWKYPVAVDLTKMVIPEAVPLLLNITNTTTRIGMVTACVVDNILSINGEIVFKNDKIKNVILQYITNTNCQLSIGVEIAECEFVQNYYKEINRQVHKASFYHGKKSYLKEISIVAVEAKVLNKNAL